MLSLVHLKTFLAVTKMGNFTRAAHELCLTQPAVSGHISALEEELGVSLFNRTGKKVVLTDAGRLVAQEGAELLDRVNQLRSALADLSDLHGGTVRIGASKIIGVYMLPKVITAFREQYPDVELQLSIHSARTIVNQVEENHYDLAVVGEGEKIQSNNIGVKAIGEDELILVASPSHPVFAQAQITAASIFNEPFVLSGDDTASLQNIKTQLRELGIHLKSTIKIGEAGAIKRAVEEGAGLAILSRAVVERELTEGRLKEVPLEHHFTRGILMLWRQDRRFSKATDAFMRVLKATLAMQNHTAATTRVDAEA